MLTQMNNGWLTFRQKTRDEGARLLNIEGQPFMEHYAPEWKELAPRDVVARSIHQEMLRTGANHVYLDLASVLPAAKIEERFPTICAKCAEYGADPTRGPIPVVPAAHYFCGGVWVDAWGRTDLARLYAAIRHRAHIEQEITISTHRVQQSLDAFSSRLHLVVWLPRPLPTDRHTCFPRPLTIESTYLLLGSIVVA